MNWSEILATTITVIVLPTLALILRTFLPPLLAMIEANTHNKDVAVIAGGSVRAAGRIALDIITAKQADPNVDLKQIISDGVKREGADLVNNLVKDTVDKLGVTQETVEKMVAGELGKTLQDKVAEVAAPVLEVAERAVTMKELFDMGLGDKAEKAVADWRGGTGGPGA